jgi:hypothetical protein
VAGLAAQRGAVSLAAYWLALMSEQTWTDKAGILLAALGVPARFKVRLAAVASRRGQGLGAGHLAVTFFIAPLTVVTDEQAPRQGCKADSMQRGECRPVSSKVRQQCI